MLATSKTAQQTRGFLCWRIAEAVAIQLSNLARDDSKVLAPYAHLFLDHLHSIASFAGDSGGDSGLGSYPSHVLDILCGTMVALTRQERGVFSLLMITIQKQLVSRAGLLSLGQAQQALHLRGHSSSSRTTSSSNVKQLMALFLTGHLLKSKITLEERDRRSLVSWILRLLSTASSEDTLVYALKLVREGMAGSSSRFLKDTASAEEQTQCASLMAQVFQQKSFTIGERDDIVSRSREQVVPFGLPSPGADGVALSADLVEFARKMQLDIRAASKAKKLEGGDVDIQTQLQDFLGREYLSKLKLLQELYRCYATFSPAKLLDSVLDCGFLLPAQVERLYSADSPTELNAVAQGDLIWIVLCSFSVAVVSANEIAACIAQVSLQQEEVAKLQCRLRSRVLVCLQLRELLEKTVLVQREVLQVHDESLTDEDATKGQTSRDDVAWLHFECAVAERLVQDQFRQDESETSATSLYGIELRTLCLFIEIQSQQRWSDAVSLTDELELFRVLSYNLRSEAGDKSHVVSGAETRSANDAERGYDPSHSSEIKRIMLESSEGKQTLRFLSTRAGELSQLVNAAADEQVGDGEDAGRETESVPRELATRSLLCIYGLFGQTMEHCNETDVPGSHKAWSGAAVKLLASGCSRDSSTGAPECVEGHQEVIYKFLLQETLKSKVRPSLLQVTESPSEGTLTLHMCCPGSSTRMRADRYDRGNDNAHSKAAHCRTTVHADAAAPFPVIREHSFCWIPRCRVDQGTRRRASRAFAASLGCIAAWRWSVFARKLPMQFPEVAPSCVPRGGIVGVRKQCCQQSIGAGVLPGRDESACRLSGAGW